MPPFDPQTYLNRRRALGERLGRGLVLIPGHVQSWRNADYPNLFRQNSHLLYLAAIQRPGLVLLMDLESGEEVIFGAPDDPDDEVWHGPHPSLAEEASRVGIERVGEISGLRSRVEEALRAGREVHLPPVFQSAAAAWLSGVLGMKEDELRQHVSRDLAVAIGDLRLRKEEGEIREIERALEVTARMFARAYEVQSPGRTEARIRAAMAEVVFSEDKDFSFAPIVTVRGEVLHNETYENTLREGDLLLIDAGVETKAGYASDITRTVPVSGRFDSRQRTIHDAVDNTRAAVIQAMAPGVNFRDLHDLASREIATALTEIGLMRGDPAEAVAAGAHALFFAHGLGHPLGLDTHDLHDLGDAVAYPPERPRSSDFGTRFLRFGRDLEEGMVMSVEPGIYFIPALIKQWKAERRHQDFIAYEEVEAFSDFGGIRIEDDVLCTADGARILGPGIPSGSRDVEAALAQSTSAR